MHLPSLFSAFLVIHLVAFTLMLGILIADFSVHARLRKLLRADSGRALAVLDASMSLPVLIGVGAILLVASGIGMVILYHGAFMHLTWFKVKMALVVLLILNGIVIGRPAGLRMKRLLEQGGPLDKVKRQIRFVHVSQFVLLLTVVVLSVFQF